MRAPRVPVEEQYRLIMECRKSGLVYSVPYVTEIYKQDKITQKRIVSAIDKLPFEGDIKRLQNSQFYRLRVGDYRILFDVNGVVIDIINIGNRGQIYKGV